MKIFYLKISDIDREELFNCAQKRNFLSEKRFLEHCAGRFLVKNVIKKYYKISDFEIIVKNKKPQLKNNELYFSVTHSNNYVMAAFDKFPCGIDLEKIRPINLEKMSKRYGKIFKNLEDFFVFWTQYEAEIKLGQISYTKYSQKFLDEYVFSVSSQIKQTNNVSIKHFLHK